jgi:integrase
MWMAKGIKNRARTTGRPRSEQTRQDILEAAYNLLQKKAFQSAGSHEIAKAAGVSSATLYGWWNSKEETFNPISKVRCSPKRLREPDVLTPQEFQALLLELPVRERAVVMLVGSTGLRRSELFALRWSDVNFLTLEIAVTRSCVRGRFGSLKTEASGKPVSLHQSVCDTVVEWRKESLYPQDTDFLFPSLRLNGTAPLMPDMVLKKIIRPALDLAGVRGKVIAYHSFRHSLATNLRSMRVGLGAFETCKFAHYDGPLHMRRVCGQAKC